MYAQEHRTIEFLPVTLSPDSSDSCNRAVVDVAAVVTGEVDVVDVVFGVTGEVDVVDVVVVVVAAAIDKLMIIKMQISVMTVTHQTSREHYTCW